MSITTAFASPTLKPLSRSLIAMLFYDIATPNSERIFDIPVARAETLFFTAFEAAAGGIIRSDRTKRKLLSTLQGAEVAELIDKFRRNGEPVPGDYFEACFATVISRGNADKIAPKFLNALRNKIAEAPDLLKKLMHGYREKCSTIPDGEAGAYAEEFFRLLNETAEEKPLKKKANGIHAEAVAVREQPVDTGALATAALDRRDTQEDGLFEAIFRNNIHSGQMIFWEQHRHSLPVRGLRHLETLLAEQSQLWVWGNAGCGKSMLISAYLYQQVFQQALRPGQIFYYRFVKDFSTYESFLRSLAKFLEIDFREEPGGQEDALAARLTTSSGLFVLDDLQVHTDRRFRTFIERCWQNVQQSGDFSGRLVLVSRTQPEWDAVAEEHLYRYEGLAVSESNALLRDLWQLPLPRMIARQLAQKLGGNPERMLLFRNWFVNEHHTDTALERFVAEMPVTDGTPEKEQELTNYVAEHLWSSFERVDSRYNSFLKAVSIFTAPEEEGFLEKIYVRMGGGDFQNKLETLVEKFELLLYDNQTGRYKLPDNYRIFYYEKLDNLQIRRALHKAAAQLYQERYARRQAAVDAVLGAEHYFRAERDDRALQLLAPVLSKKNLPVVFAPRLLILLKSAELGIIEAPELRSQALFARGRLQFQQNKIIPAEKDLSAALSLQPPASNRAEIFYYLALIASAKGQSEQALQLLKQSCDIFTELDEPEGIARATARMADVDLVGEKLKAAEENYTRAQALYEQMGDLRSQLYILNQLAAIARTRHQWDQALGYYQRVREIAQLLHDPAEKALALSHLGQIHEVHGRWEDAMETYQREIAVRKMIHDAAGVARAQERIGRIFRQQGNTEAAFDWFESARLLFEERQDRTGMASIYKHLGLIYFDRGDWEMAMEYYHRSLEILEQLNDRAGIGEIYICIARAYRRIGEYERALDMLDKALEIRERVGDTPGVADIYEEIGDVYCEREQPAYALEVYERAIGMKENHHQWGSVGEIYFKIGEMHRTRESGESAERFYHLALDYFGKAGNPAGMAKTCRSLGEFYHAERDGEQAVKYFEQAVTGWKESGEISQTAATLFQLGNVHYDFGNWQRALVHYQEALPLFEQTGDLFSIARVMGNTSSIEFEQQEHAAAIRKQVEILLFFESRQESELMEKVLNNLVACHQKLGADVFQPLLTACLERVTREGVRWGSHQVIDPRPAAEMVQRIFYNF